MTNKKLSQQWDHHSSKILATAINGLNEVRQQERTRKLTEFTTEALEKEILSRQKCHFGRLTCTEKAEGWITEPKDPACANCKQDILILAKDKEK